MMGKQKVPQVTHVVRMITSAGLDRTASSAFRRDADQVHTLGRSDTLGLLHRPSSSAAAAAGRMTRTAAFLVSRRRKDDKD